MITLFTSPDVSPQVYDLLFTKEFGGEYQHWLPETLYAEIEKTWGVTPSEPVANKINALKVFKANPGSFYTYASVFEHVVLAINGFSFDPEMYHFCEAEDIIYALSTLKADPAKLSEAVIGYVRACLDKEGFLKAPHTLEFAQGYIPPSVKDFFDKISPKFYKKLDQTNLVEVQSAKLYDVGARVADRLQKSLVVLNTGHK